MERLGDTLNKYPFRPHQPQEQKGMVADELERMLGISGEPVRKRQEESALKQDTRQNLPQQDDQVCRICHGSEWLRQELPVGDPNFGKLVPCVCQEKKKTAKRKEEMQERSNLAVYRSKTFDTFDPRVHGVRGAFEKAQEYAREPDGWLVLSGPVGCGKTHLAAAIARVVVSRGTPVLFSTVPELMDHLREAFAPTHEIPYHKLFDDIREVELLVLDDLGVEYTTPWATEKLFQIMNFRYINRTPTIITMNGEALKSDPKNLDIRILSRLSDKGLVNWCRIEAQDYRLHNVPPKQVRRPQR